MKGLKYFLLLSLASAALLPGGTAARADTISLSAHDTSAFAGDIVEFDAIITNLNPYSELYVNGYKVTSLTSPLILDDIDTDTAFFNITWPLDPGGAYTGALFFVTVPLGTANGTYVGDFQVLGGSDGDIYDLLGDEVLGDEDFTINVGGESPVPEPSSLVLLLTGIAGLAGTIRRRLVQ